MRTISAGDFERRYRAEGDPWDYLKSEYERRKYAATLAACGPGPFTWALELGGSIGVFSALLAPRCKRLVTIDVAPTAVRSARARLSGLPQVTAILGSIPQDIPQRPFDLVVASEILYYLSDAALDGTLQLLERDMVAGSSLVAVHWRPAGPERPRDAERAHAALLAAPWLSHVRSQHTDDYLLDVFAR
jgi:SAM-dependent methyltransferase